MKKITLSFLATIIFVAITFSQNEVHFYLSSDKNIGNHNTVSSGPDNGANDNMGRLFWNCMRHSTTEQAINNWLGRLGGRLSTNEEIERNGNGSLVIGGHGNEGFLETGSGQNGQTDYRTNFLATWNKFIWDAFFQRLRPKNFPVIYIYSCHSGAGTAGAEFLYQLALSTGHPVAGRTGFVYSNNQNIWFENGSVWQVATPDRKPDPIASPTPHFTSPAAIILNKDKKQITLKDEDVIELKVIKTAITNVDQQQNTVFPKDISKAVTKDLFGSTPFKIGGELMAVVTHKVYLKLKTDKEFVLEFNIYNNRLIGDGEGNYYFMLDNSLSLIK